MGIFWGWLNKFGILCYLLMQILLQWNQCKNCKASGAKIFWRGPKYKVLNIIPISFSLVDWNYNIVIITLFPSLRNTFFSFFFFILTHPSLILLRYGRWELKIRTEPNMHLRCGTHPKWVMGNGNWALVDENCLNQTGFWSMSSGKYGINPMACG